MNKWRRFAAWFNRNFGVIENPLWDFIYDHEYGLMIAFATLAARIGCFVGVLASRTWAELGLATAAWWLFSGRGREAVARAQN